MQAIREVINSKGKDCHISLPSWAIGKELEIIIIPIEKEQEATRNNQKTSLIHQLSKHPIKQNGFVPLSREQTHER